MAEHLVAVLQFHRRVETRGVGVHLERTLGQLHAERRQFGDRGGDLDGAAGQAVGLHQLADQTTAVGFVGRHGAPGQHPVGGDAGSDDPRQVVAHPHFGAGQSQQDGGISECGCAGADPDIGGQTQREPAADAGAVDRGDDGLRQVPDRTRQRRHRLLEPQPVDGGVGGVGHPRPEIAHVDAGTEAPARAGQNDGFDRFVVTPPRPASR